MKQHFLLFAFLLIALTIHANSTVLKKSQQKNGDILKADQPRTYKVSLERIDTPADQVAEFLTLLTDTHDRIRSDYRSSSFLGERSQTTASAVHEMKLGNFKNSQYVGELSIGDELEKYQVIFDTGSANIWIDSSKCNDAGCKSHKQYDGSKSQTYKNLGFQLDVEFGTGELIGEINSDNVFLAGVKVENQKVSEITKQIGSVFLEAGFDGIVGLAYPSMAAYGMDPLFDNVMKQGKLDSNVFSFYYDSVPNSQSSHLIFGGTDSKYFSGPLTYFPVIDKYYWSIKASNILLNGKDFGLCRGGCKLVADTGTSLITGPSDAVSILLNEMDLGAGCSSKHSLPTITFLLSNGGSAFNGQSYTLTPDDYVIDNADYDEGIGCAPGIMPLDVDEPHGPLWILGDLFLKKYYSVYDRDHNQVGFALSKPGVY